MNDHLSSLLIDSLELGALAADEAARARSHLDGCERCRADLARLRDARAHFDKVVLPRTLAKVAGRRRRSIFALGVDWSFAVRRPFLVALPLVAAASLLLLLSPRPMPMPITRDQAIRAKGGEPALRGYARRDGRVFPVSDGSALSPGDDLRFVVEPAGRRYVLIASIDGAGHAAVYYPWDGTASAPLGPAPRIELPGSIRLDAAPGPERIFALLSDEPIAAPAVLDDLRNLGARGAEAIRDRRILDGSGEKQVGAQATLLFEKALP